ncbi:MAG: hypothetical protein WCS95_08805 [Lentisphaeria bacterium]
MEIGSFIEMQFARGLEYYQGESFAGLSIARLNSGKAGILHAFRLTGCKRLWLPLYLCDCVRELFRRQQIELRHYHIDRNFNPLNLKPTDEEAVLLVNYYGVMSESRMRQLAAPYPNVIIDNCQAFFAPPLPHCQNVYSCRKFIGVPDGAYVIGSNAEKFMTEYEQGYSSDTALFLLLRLEYGCEGKAYAARMQNERRLENEPPKKMSKLTRSILDGSDYPQIIAKRRENFFYAQRLFASLNLLKPLANFDETCVPMIYPLLLESDTLLHTLQANKHFQGHWWSYLLHETPPQSAEHWLSKYIIPISIDQRYGKKELDFLHKLTAQHL